MVEIRQLNYFIQVSEIASLSQAAVQLQVSTSILSRTIQDLERELGGHLFYRTGRGMKLTEYGRQLLPRARQVTQELSKFVDEAMALRGNLSGTVSIGLPGSIAAIIASPVLKEAQIQFPEVSLRFVEILSGEADEQLSSGRIDIAIFYANKANSSGGEVTLMESDFFLVSSPDDDVTAAESVTLAEVARCPLILPSRPNAVRDMMEDVCARQNRDIYVQCEVDSLFALKEIIALGTGYTVTTFDAVANEITTKKLRASRITEPNLARLLVMSLAPKNSLTMSARAVASLISDVSAQFVTDGRWKAAPDQAADA